MLRGPHPGFVALHMEVSTDGSGQWKPGPGAMGPGCCLPGACCSEMCGNTYPHGETLYPSPHTGTESPCACTQQEGNKDAGWKQPPGAVAIPFWHQGLPWVIPRVPTGRAGPFRHLSPSCNCTGSEGHRSTWPSQPGTPVHVLTACSSQDLIKVHHSFLRAIDVSMMAGGSTLAKVFLDFKER